MTVVCTRDFGPLEKPKWPTRTSSAKYYFDLALICNAGRLKPTGTGGSYIDGPFSALRTQFLIYKTINSDQLSEAKV